MKHQVLRWKGEDLYRLSAPQAERLLAADRDALCLVSPNLSRRYGNQPGVVVLAMNLPQKTLAALVAEFRHQNNLPVSRPVWFYMRKQK